jgi:CubicO group peptidase (beta-lactamase class C family)
MAVPTGRRAEEANVKIEPQKIDAIFSEWDRPDSPGCALGVVHEGKLAYARGYGSANLEYDVPIAPSTLFHVASVSKQFTAMAAALLAAEGKLSLDDDVREFVPELWDFGRRITIRHLVLHTSGLRDQWLLLVLAGWRFEDVITTDDAMWIITRQRTLNFDPGTEHLYCNAGYTLLGEVVRRVSGKSLAAFCRERIFEPLGMDRSFFLEDHSTIVKGRAYSYAPLDGGGFEHSVLSFSTTGPTSVLTNVEDLALWEKNFTEGKVGGPEVLEFMVTPGRLADGEELSYAFGLQTGEYRGLGVVEHGGFDAGFKSQFLRIPRCGFAVSVLGNLRTMNPSELARRVADVCLGDAFPEPPPAGAEAPAVSVGAQELKAKAGLYLHEKTGRIIRLEVRNGRLFSPTGKGIELVARERARFGLKDSPRVEYLFEPEGTEPARRVTEKAGSAKPVILTRVDPYIPNQEEREAFAGSYHSSELEAGLEVSHGKEGLVIRHRKLGESPLEPTCRDAFSWDGSHLFGVPYKLDLRFERGGQGAITGFGIFTGRVRNLWYQKVEGGRKKVMGNG